MQVIRNKPEWNDGPRLTGQSVVTVGNFDGMHLGHRALLDRCQKRAGSQKPVAVVTFEPLPQAFFQPHLAPARITTVYQKLALLRSAGVDATWLMRFDRSLATMPAREFARQVLAKGLQAQAVVVGEDFRFGRGQEGDVEMLASLGRELRFEVDPVPAVLAEGERISSSRIRQSLAAGDFFPAAELLGRPFRMEGHVIRGAGLGRKLGYPTANLAIRAEPSPLGGVLAAFARVAGGPWLPAVTNLGRRPAVGGKEPLLEVHFFDFDQDLYGKRLEVQFVAKLREELDFGSLDDLKARMQKDELEARQVLVDATSPRDEHLDND